MCRCMGVIQKPALWEARGDTFGLRFCFQGVKFGGGLLLMPLHDIISSSCLLLATQDQTQVPQ